MIFKARGIESTRRRVCPIVTFTPNPHFLMSSKPNGWKAPAGKVQKFRRYFLVDWQLTERSRQRRRSRLVSFRSNSKTVTALSPQLSVDENITHKSFYICKLFVIK